MSIDDQITRVVTAFEAIAANLEKAFRGPIADPLQQRAERQHSELMAQAAAAAPDIQNRTATALERLADSHERLLALHAAGTPPVLAPVVTTDAAYASDDADRQRIIREQAEREEAQRVKANADAERAAERQQEMQAAAEAARKKAAEQTTDSGAVKAGGGAIHF